MKYSQLESIFRFTKVIIKNDSLNISGLTHCRFPRDNSLVLINQKKQFFELLGNLVSGNRVALVIEEKLYAELESEIGLQSESFSFLATGNNLRLRLAEISQFFYDQKFHALNANVDGRQLGTTKVHPTAQVAQNVFLGDSVEICEEVIINPGCVILGPCKIGKGTHLFPNVTIYPFTNIGKNCRLHAGSVIGADGFGYVKDKGVNHKIWHFSGVEIGDEVEVGATSTIDCGALYPTQIGNKVKIDNSVTIGHNVIIGNHVVICGQVAVAGSCIISDHCTLGGRAGLAPSVELKENVSIAANASVSEGIVVDANKVMAGTPAIELKEHLKIQARLRILAKK